MTKALQMTDEELREVLAVGIHEYANSHKREVNEDWVKYGNEMVAWLNERFDNRMAAVAFLDFIMFTQRLDLRKMISRDFKLM